MNKLFDPTNPRSNHILASLPEEEYVRISEHLMPFTLSLGEVIFEPNVVMKEVYFPVKGIVSLL